MPVATWTLVHMEAINFGRLILVTGGSIFSGLSVFGWCQVIFGHRLKALGFTVLLEGVMLLSTTMWLSVCALLLLVTVNSVFAAVALTRDNVQKGLANG